MGLFQKRLQLVLHPPSQPRQLKLAARHRAPQSLFGIGHEAQDQFLGHQPFHQSFGIRKILLPPRRPPIRQRLR